MIQAKVDRQKPLDNGSIFDLEVSDSLKILRPHTMFQTTP